MAPMRSRVISLLWLDRTGNKVRSVETAESVKTLSKLGSDN